MSTLALLIVCASVLVLAGMVLNAIPDVMRARADARLAAQPELAGYSADVVRLAVRGALLTVGADEQRVDTIAELVLDELEHEGHIFDGHTWRSVA